MDWFRFCMTGRLQWWEKLRLYKKSTEIIVIFWNQLFLQETPRQGIEPWSPAWQAGILTTILSRTGSKRSSSKVDLTIWNKSQLTNLVFWNVFMVQLPIRYLDNRCYHLCNYTPRAMWKNFRCRANLNSTTSALGFLHSRTNLSPFTKDFRGGDQLDEYLTIFLGSGFVRTDTY